MVNEIVVLSLEFHCGLCDTTAVYCLFGGGLKSLKNIHSYLSGVKIGTFGLIFQHL